MLADLEALTPPLIMGGAFLIGVVMFLRRQMGPRRQSEDDHDENHAVGFQMQAAGRFHAEVTPTGRSCESPRAKRAVHSPPIEVKDRRAKK